MPKKKDEIEIVLDVETTGLDYTKEKIIEFGAVKLVNGEITEKFETLINAKQHIRKSSEAIHGITEEMLVDAPTEEEIFPKIFEFIGDYPIVAHNAIFDFSFLNRTSKRLYNKPLENHHIDTQIMFKEVYPQLESCGLESLMRLLPRRSYTGSKTAGKEVLLPVLKICQCQNSLNILHKPCMLSESSPYFYNNQPLL